MSHRIAIELSDEESALLDDVVARGEFPDKKAAIHGALDRGLQASQEAEIEEAYRRAYTETPEEEIWGEVGERLAAESLRDPSR